MPAPESVLRIASNGDGPARRISLAGELDASTCDRLREHLDELLAQGCRDLELELSALDFVDSSGLAVLVTAHKRLDERGGRLRMTAPSPAVLRVLEMTGLARLLGGG